jgi:REP element-mobilizing transposase RayT
VDVTAGWDDLGVGYRSSNKKVCSAIIWCPNLRWVLAGPVKVRLTAIIARVVAEAGGEVIEVEVMPDLVQLLVEVPPAVGLSKLVQELQGRSSPAWGRVRACAEAAALV